MKKLIALLSRIFDLSPVQRTVPFFMKEGVAGKARRGNCEKIFFHGWRGLLSVFACLFLFSAPSMAAGLPSGYTQVEYIDNNGTAWLDLGMPIGTSDVVTFDMKWNTLVQAPFFGGYNSGGSFSSQSFVGTYVGGSSAFGFYSNSNAPVGGHSKMTTRSVLKWNGINAVPTLDGTAIAQSSALPYADFTPSVNAYLFTRNQGGTAGSVDDITLYSFKVERNGATIMDLVPVKNSSGVYGMYNVLDSNPETAFYGNKGTGAFTGGDPVAQTNSCPNGLVQQTANWNQLWNPDNVYSMNGNGLTMTKNNNQEWDCTVTSVLQYASGYLSSSGSFIVGHKYVFAADFTVLVDDNIGNHSTQFRQWNGTGVTYGAQNLRFSAVNETQHAFGKPFTANSTMTDFGMVFVTQYSNAAVGTKTRISNIQLFDLTEMFGAGNEPTTDAEAQRLVTQRATLLGITAPNGYYEYNAGENMEYCAEPIRIATTKYNNAAFSSVVTALNNAVDTIKTVVANTINQATAVANLQSGKQTMPNSTTTNGTCPNYKQCLLVEDDNGTPHWYVITDPFRDYVTPIIANSVNGWDYIGHAGYTQLEYIESTGTQYIDTGVTGPARWVGAAQSTSVSDKSQCILGADYVNNSAYLASVYLASQVGNSGGVWRLGGASSGASSTVATTDYAEYDVNFAETSFSGTINGESLSASSVSGFTNWHIGMARGASSIYYFIGKIYTQKAYQNNTLVRDFVPVRRNSDGVLGMYDLAATGNQQVFYPNAATSGADFTAGNPVASPNPALPTTPTWTVAWAPDSDYAGTVNGTAKCNNSASDATATTSGSNCWCRVTSILVDGTTTNVDGTWAFRTGSGWTDSCVAECATSCAAGVYNNATFRRTVFGM